MTHLSVNVNKIALLRNARDIGIPSVLQSVEIALEAGAHGITVHPRPDQRHIRNSDVYEISKLLNSWKNIEFNIEGNPFEKPLLDLARYVLPSQCTLVPDSPNAWTSDHGWDINKDATRLIPVINELKKLGIRVSLFMDPDPEAIELAVSLGIDRIELYTEPYAKAFATDLESAVLSKYVESASVAQSSGVLINAGHDLNLINLFKFLNTVENVQEVSIGHALIADALVLGLDAAVKKYLLLMKSC